VELRDVQDLVQASDRGLVLLVLDGLGGLPREAGGKTELEAARTPNLDHLARAGAAGLHEPVAPGVTPGSGPGHLALFGYDPLRYRIGRGVLEALGIGFELTDRDVAVRGNFATLDDDGAVADRRAGRISTEAARPLAEALDGLTVEGAEVHVRPVKEHRFLLVLRFPEPVEADLSDTDPGRPGDPPRPVRAGTEASERAARAARAWLEAAREELSSRDEADTVLLRGFATVPDWPRFPDVWGMRALAVAAYPMYRGAARLVGMDAVRVDGGVRPLVDELQDRTEAYDFVFLHFKDTDRAGEDGDFRRKVELIEEVDAAVPRLLDAGQDVTLVTGDHSTPSVMKTHSWHPVPFVVAGGRGRSGGAEGFGETECARGVHGLRRGRELMPLAVARTGRLSKYGA
jgi:2,3-bisphosphoglycerate-independent phosphoglycerate mutase